MQDLTIYQRYHDLSVYDDLLTIPVTINFTDQYVHILLNKLYTTHIFQDIPNLSHALYSEFNNTVHDIKNHDRFAFKEYSDYNVFKVCDHGDAELTAINNADYAYFTNHSISASLAYQLLIHLHDLRCDLPPFLIRGINVFNYLHRLMYYAHVTADTNICLVFLAKLTRPLSERLSYKYNPLDIQVYYYKVLPQIIPPKLSSIYESDVCTGATFESDTYSISCDHDNCQFKQHYRGRQKRSLTVSDYKPFEHNVIINNKTIPILQHMTMYGPLPMRNRLKDVLDYEGISYPKSRRRRWDSSVVCGWPIVSSAAKILGGECSISPAVESIKTSLQTTKRIVTEQQETLNSLYKGIILNNKHLQTIYKQLGNQKHNIDDFHDETHLKSEIDRYWLTINQRAITYIQGYHAMLIYLNTLRLGKSDSNTAELDELLNLGTLLNNYNATISSASLHNVMLSDVEIVGMLGGVSNLRIDVSVPIYYGKELPSVVFSALTLPICYKINETLYTSTDYSAELVCDTKFTCYRSNLADCYQTNIGTYLCPRNTLNIKHQAKLRKASHYECQTDYLIPPHSLYILNSTTINIYKCNNNTIDKTITLKQPPTMFDMACGYIYQTSTKLYHNCYCNNVTTYYYKFDSNNSLIPNTYLYDKYIDSSLSFELNSSNIDNTLDQRISEAIKDLNTTGSNITSDFEYHKNRVLSDLDELSSEIDSIHGNMSSWLTYVILAVVTILTFYILSIFCRGANTRYSMLLLALLLPLAAAGPVTVDDDNFPGNCTVTTDITACSTRDFDACYLLESTSYCFCENTAKYSKPTGRSKCVKPHYLLKPIIDFFRNIFEPANLNLVLSIIILIVLFLHYYHTKTSQGRSIIPFRKRQ